MAKNEPVDYVAEMKNMNEISRKNKITQLRWLHQYEWLCDEYKNVQEEMKKLCEEKHACDETSDVKIDERSVMPIPQTTNGLYGWLAAKKNFNMEKYGSYIVKYPLEEVTFLSGDIPTLAAGKGVI